MTDAGVRKRVHPGLAGPVAAALFLSACATNAPAPPLTAGEPTAASVIASSLGQAGPPATGRSVGALATPAAIEALVAADPVDVTLPPQPLPQLLDTVFSGILGLAYNLGPNIGARTDIVALRSAPGADKRALFQQTQDLLAAYGLAVRVQDSAVQIVDAGAATAPLTLEARPGPAAAADSATSRIHRASAVSPAALAALMSDIFPAATGVAFAPDPAGDSVTVSGAARDVALADNLLAALDNPRFAGVAVVRAQPTYWSAESLAEALRESLAGEGYRISDRPAEPRSVLVLAVPRSNQVLIFAGDPAALESARTWVGRLDRPESLGAGPRTFVYQVRNTDASALVGLITASRGTPMNTLLDQTGLPGQPPQDTAAANAARPMQTGSFGDGRLAVDEGTNRIVFTGSAEAFTELRGLIAALDTPRPQVLVEVTIAEVTLTDETRAGLEFFFTRSMSDGVLSGGTDGGLGLGSGGLSLTFAGLDVQAQFQAFASNNNVNILSRPRLVARSGDEARIQVGTDVPIITSRANSSTSTGGNTDILQTIQYRQTGVILRIRPIIYSDGRIDLEITQEVSSQQPNTNATIASPLILNRSISTRLLLDEGATAVLGGLIDDSFSTTNSGVPFLKDIPVLGSAFRVDSVSGGKTELVMLVTPHILRDGGEMAFWAEQSAAEMNDAFAAGRGWSYTLTPLTADRLRIETAAPAPVR